MPIDRHQPGIEVIPFLETFKCRTALSIVKSGEKSVSLFSDKSR